MSIISMLIFFLLETKISFVTTFDFEEGDFEKVDLCVDKILTNPMNITLNQTVFIKSPGFDNSVEYEPNMNCKIVLNGLNGINNMGIFKINFDIFDLEDNKVCAFYDFVKIYRQVPEVKGWDQVLDISTPDSNGICGTKTRNTLSRIATGENLFFHFKTDNSINGKGFNVSVSYSTSDDFPIIEEIGYKIFSPIEETFPCRETEVPENGSVTLYCSLKTYNPSTTEVKWFKIDKGLKEIRIDIIKDEYRNGTLTLEKLELEDEGAYICRASNKFGTVTEKMYIKIIEKCICPKVVNVTWYEYLPYTMSIKEFENQQKPVYKGIFYEILEAMIPIVCGECLRGHGKSRIYWNEQSNRRNSFTNVIADIEKFHLALPILYLKNQEKFRVNYFVPIIKAPGYLLLQQPVNDRGKQVFSVLFGCLPLLLITIAIMVCAGIIIWMLEMKWNTDQFSKTFVQGVWQGIWWAFVTMTTVGYGDIAPKGYLGRIFSFFWMILGISIISILTGAISAGLYVVSLNNPVLFYGESVGAIDQSAEYRYAFAQMNSATGYKDYTSMVDDLKSKKIQSILVDSYVAGAYQELSNLTINQIIPMDGMSYGIVLGHEMNTKDVQLKMLDYFEKNTMSSLIIRARNVQKYENAEPFGLFDSKSPMFITALLTMFGLLMLSICGGLAFDYGYHKPKQREIMNANNLDMIESKTVKEMAKSTPITRDDILADLREQLQCASERINNINKIHMKQKTFFLEKKKPKNEDEEILIFKESKDETQV